MHLLCDCKSLGRCGVVPRVRIPIVTWIFISTADLELHWVSPLLCFKCPCMSLRIMRSEMISQKRLINFVETEHKITPWTNLVK